MGRALWRAVQGGLTTKQKAHISYTRTIVLVILAIILVGALLLCLPVASRSGRPTGFVDALFTATSATCVTGLVVADTFQHWTLFGQIVILLLIQIGGLGFMSFAMLFSLFLGKKINLRQRSLLQESLNVQQVGGLVRLVRHILLGTAIFEGAGAILLSFRFIPELGISRGIWNAVFHSVSAFCNAGFDLMGRRGAYGSLTEYSGDPLVILTISALIIIGGLGFFVWEDLYVHRWKFNQYRLQTKVVLVTTLGLIAVSTVLILLWEMGGSFAGKSGGDAFLSALFSAVTPRTAGFNSVEVTAMSHPSKILTMCLMMIGGAPGSTAGGIKVTTLAVLALAAISVYRRTGNLTAFGRRLPEDILKRACTILFVYLSLVLMATMAICWADPLDGETAVFQAISAIGTVGLSIADVGVLSIPSKLILAFLMYFGRVGCLTLVFALHETRDTAPVQYPVEKVAIG